MIKRLRPLAFLTLTLCVSSFLLHVPLYAFADNSAEPVINAWIGGDMIHVEIISDKSQVETVFIDGFRINYHVNGTLSVALNDFAGSDRHIRVFAVSFLGSKSNIVQLKNPNYVPAPAPTVTPTVIRHTATPTPTRMPTATPVPTQVPTAPLIPSNTPEPTQIPIETPIPTEAPIEATLGDSAEAQEAPEFIVNSESRPFTPDGTGTVVDNVIEQNGREFFTIRTPDGNDFYLIIDRLRSSENVYLLNQVTEEDLISLADQSSNMSQSAIPTLEPTPTPISEPDDELEQEPEAPTRNNGSNSFLIVLLVALGIGGAGYYFKVIKPKQSMSAEDDYDDEDDLDDAKDDDDYDYSFEDDADEDSDIE